jgi:hypothetical protein
LVQHQHLFPAMLQLRYKRASDEPAGAGDQNRLLFLFTHLLPESSLSL